jgi:hypothetical protein
MLGTKKRWFAVVACIELLLFESATPKNPVQLTPDEALDLKRNKRGVSWAVSKHPFDNQNRCSHEPTCVFRAVAVAACCAYPT